MTPEMDDFIISMPSKKSSEVKAIADSMKERESFFNRQRFKFNNWLVTKGWIYIMVFFMGMLLGGLIWK